MVGSKIKFKTNCGTFRPLYVLFGIHIFRYTVWNAISYKTLHKAPCNGASLQVKCTRNFKEEKGTAFHQDIAEPCQLTTQRAALSAQRPRSAAAVTPPPTHTVRRVVRLYTTEHAPNNLTIYTYLFFRTFTITYLVSTRYELVWGLIVITTTMYLLWDHLRDKRWTDMSSWIRKCKLWL